MPIAEGFRTSNVEAVSAANELLRRAKELGAQVELLSDSVWAVFLSRGQRHEQRSILATARALRNDVGPLDADIVDYWRLDPNLQDRVGPSWFETQMATRAIIRDTILRYANDAMQAVHENQLRAAARATLWLTIVVVSLSAIAAAPVIREWFSHEANKPMVQMHYTIVQRSL